jgi:hypothetical protein
MFAMLSVRIITDEGSSWQRPGGDAHAFDGLRQPSAPGGCARRVAHAACARVVAHGEMLADGASKRVAYGEMPTDGAASQTPGQFWSSVELLTKHIVKRLPRAAGLQKWFLSQCPRNDIFLLFFSF